MNHIYSILGLNFKIIINFFRDLPGAGGYALRR